jgi:hypothetical protein
MYVHVCMYVCVCDYKKSLPLYSKYVWNIISVKIFSLKETRVRRAEALRILASEYKKKSVSDKDGLTTFVTQMGAQTGYTYTQHIHTYLHTYIH